MALSEQRIAEIQERLKDLSPEEQQQKLQEILKELPQDELNEITQQQCPFCGIVEKKIDAKTVYEDGIVMAVLDINPANKGHVILFPKKHYQFLFQVSDTEVAYMFKMINKISLAMVNGLNAEGNNIFVANGQIAGQNASHVIVHIIPRYKDDGIDFKWDFKKVNDEEMLNLVSAIKKSIVTHKEVKVNKKTNSNHKEKERIA